MGGEGGSGDGEASMGIPPNSRGRGGGGCLVDDTVILATFSRFHFGFPFNFILHLNGSMFSF